MIDYIGKYVKKFESGTKGSLSLSQCGNDWGLSAGSYQLTLRWGNCINFLKTYFPQNASSLYYKAVKDFASKTYPGMAYCSSPEAVISVWMSCYNKVGASRFFEYEHSYIQGIYYNKIREKIKPILDLDSTDRGFQECFWSWSVHKGVTGCYNTFLEVLKEHNIDSLDYVEKEDLFDMIYDKRYEIDAFTRYQKGNYSGACEREVLRPLITAGTFSGKSIVVEEPVEETPVVVEPVKEEVEITFTPVNGTVKVIYKGIDGLMVRTEPSFSAPIVDVLTYGDTRKAVAITSDNTMYKLDSGYFVSASNKYVQFIKEDAYLYLVRITADSLNIRSGPSALNKTVGSVKKNQVFTIIEEQNGWGLLKSKAGWIYLEGYTKKYE